MWSLDVLDTFHDENMKRTLQRHGAFVKRRGAGDRSRARLHGICCGSETPLSVILRAVHDRDEPSMTITKIDTEHKILLDEKDTNIEFYL